MNYIDWEGMIRELQQIMLEEVDYRYESAHLRLMRKALKSHKIYVPKFYARYSGSKVLTMEMVQGLLMADYLKLERSDPQRLKQWCEENNVKPKKVGRRLLLSFYRQLFEENLFHGDLHPGNIILLRNSRLALIDLGSVGNLEPRFLANYKQQAVALAQRQYAKAADLYLLMADQLPVVDVASFRAEMVDVYRRWEARSRMRGLTYLERSITGGVANDVSDIARKYKVNPSWQFLRVARAMGTLEANLNALLGKSNPVKLIRRYNEESNKRALKHVLDGGVVKLVGAATTLAEVTGHATDMLRRQAIQFEGVTSTGGRIIGLIAGWFRIGLVIAAGVVLYDLFYEYFFTLVDDFHPFMGPLARFAEATPKIDFGVQLVIILAIGLVAYIAGQIRSEAHQKRIRLPSGKSE